MKSSRNTLSQLREIVGTTRIRALLAGLLHSTLAATAWAQTSAQPQLYAGLVNSRGYVVGTPLSASGMYRFESDTSWGHIGWNHPRVSAIAFHPTHPDTIYIAGGNGALRSVDRGRSWRITTDWRVTETQDIDIDRGTPSLVYLATAYGVWRTRDGAESWQLASEGLPKRYTQTVHADRTRANRVFAGTEGGLFVSENQAEEWRAATDFTDAVLDIDQGIRDPEVFLAGTQDKGVLISTDAGATWVRAAGAIDNASIYAVAIDPFDADRMAAAGWDTGVFLSEDRGRIWRRADGALPVPHVYELVFDAIEPGKIWAATVEHGIFSSANSGRSWAFNGMYGSLVFELRFYPERVPNDQ